MNKDDRTQVGSGHAIRAVLRREDLNALAEFFGIGRIHSFGLLIAGRVCIANPFCKLIVVSIF